jgi:hypothetical protein
MADITKIVADLIAIIGMTMTQPAGAAPLAPPVIQQLEPEELQARACGKKCNVLAWFGPDGVIYIDKRVDPEVNKVARGILSARARASRSETATRQQFQRLQGMAAARTRGLRDTGTLAVQAGHRSHTADVAGAYHAVPSNGVWRRSGCRGCAPRQLAFRVLRT